MTRRQAARALLPACLLGSAAFAPPAGQALPYDLAGVLAAPVEPFVPPVEPGEQYPPSPQDRTIATVPDEAAPEEPTPARRGPDFTLTVDASVTADSNVTNSTDSRTVAVDYGSGRLPVPLDPNLREKSGIGRGASATAGAKLPVAPGLSLALGAEGYVLDYDGRLGDDSSVLGAAGVELQAGHGTGTLQALAFDRWYAGTSAMHGFGLRASWKQEVAPGQHLNLYADARRFDSDYGRAFGGKQAGVYLSYDIVLDPTLTAAGGVYVRRDWLRDDAYSSTELGAYGNLAYYISGGLLGGVSGGISRARFEAPVAFLSPDPRHDWRWYASAYLTTRKPVAWGLYPSLTYTYGRTSSSIDFYDAERHRLRLGLMRSF